MQPDIDLTALREDPTVVDLVHRIALFQRMPLTFNALVIEKVSRCNARCAMCYQSAGPRGSDEIGDVAITVEDLLPVIDGAAKISTVQPRFHLTGGEAFLMYDDCLVLFKRAKAAGFLDITSTTNAYWARKPDKAERICGELHMAGVTGLEVSWDIWHRPFIPLEAINHCLLSASKYGIEINLRILTSKSHSIEEALAGLDHKALDKASRISSGPVFPSGRASRTLDRTDLFKQGSLEDNCHTFLNLTVNARGEVFPCCAGIDQTKTLKLGNIRETAIAEIVASMNRSLILRSVVFYGISTFLPILPRAGFALPDEDFNSICHLCWSIFSVPEHVEAIRAHFTDIEQTALENAIVALAEKHPVLAEASA